MSARDELQPRGGDRVDETVAEPLRRARPTLDELHRARLAAAIEERLDRAIIATGGAADHGATASARGLDGRRRLGLRGSALVLVSAAVAAGVVALVLTRGGGRPHVAGAPTPAPAVGVRATGAEAASFVPYLYAGADAEHASLDPVRRLVAPAGGRIRATLGGRVRLTLVGPGAVTTAVEGGATEMSLEAGLLLVDYAGGAAKPLTVRSPGAVTRVVGTLFSVEAHQGRTRVGVARGAVDTDGGAGARRIAAGRQWTSGEPRGTEAELAADLAASLAEHDSAPPPPSGATGVLRIEPEQLASGPLAIDGRALATGQLLARVAAGSHRIEVPGGALDVRVTAGETVSLAGPLPAALATKTPAARRGGGRPAAVARRAPQEQPPPANAGDGEREREEDVDAAYASAERLMRAGAVAEARTALERIVAIAARHPRGGAGEAALVDLARLSLSAGNPRQARAYLDRLSDPPADATLAETALRLRCRAERLAGSTAEAIACLVTFRRRYPDSPHDAEMLALLASLATDCAEARPLLEEYLRLHPQGRFAPDATARLARCGR